MPVTLNFNEIIEMGITRIYKFKKFDSENFYKPLLENKVYLASRTILNDPKDCRILLNYNLCSDDGIKNKMRYLLRGEPVRSREARVQEQFIKWKKNREHYRNLLEKELDDKIGVFSLTTDFSEKMWKEYADNHSGFCMEFDVNKIFDSLKRKFERQNKRIFILKVTYDNGITQINPCESTLDEKSQMFLVKETKWSDENEWRIISFGWNGECEPIEPECITKIYFGSNSSEENISVCKEILKVTNPKIEMFRTTKLDKSNELINAKIK